MDEPLSVEVFPSEPDRWIAVIEVPAGPLSTQASSPAEVYAQVRRCITEVLGRDVSFMLVDDLGAPWSPAGVDAQLARLDAKSESAHAATRSLAGCRRAASAHSVLVPVTAPR